VIILKQKIPLYLRDFLFQGKLFFTFFITAFFARFGLTHGPAAVGAFFIVS
jgi:hypothetical protein